MALSSWASCASLALVLAFTGCKGSSSSSPDGQAAPAMVRWTDAGAADLVVGERVVPLPMGELAVVRPIVRQDESGTRLAYVNAAGEVRVVHVLNGNAYLGPTSKAPIDFRALPDLDASLGALFENAGARRAQLVADVTKEKGEAGVARMLVDGAHVQAREWDEVYAKLPEARAADVRRALGASLERGAPSSGLGRAVVLVPLSEPARANGLAARVRELVEPVREPRAAAVMLRALASLDKAQAAEVGCEVLGKSPLGTANAKGSPDEIDRPGREALVEAALVAVAAGAAECPHVAAQLGDDVCFPYYRCGESGPLTGRESSKQDEPLCTKEQLAKAVAKELERTPADVAAITGGTRPQLFAFAALAATGKVPASFAAAHARRRYALVQPKEPSCESGVAPGTPCHCDEATIRDQTCRQPVSTSVHVGLCKFAVDDKQKKISDVVAALPP